MASLKSNTADKRRTTGREREYRESSKSRTSELSRDASKSRNEKTHKSEKPHDQEKYRRSSREVPRQTAQTARNSRETAKDAGGKMSRTNTKVTETKLVKDPASMSKKKLPIDSKLNSKKVESIISTKNAITKEAPSKSSLTSKSTHSQNIKSTHSALKSSSSPIKETIVNKSVKLDEKIIDDISNKSKILTSRYPTFDIENDDQSDIEEDYPDDFENYDSDFEESSGQEDEIEDNTNQQIGRHNGVPHSVDAHQSEAALQPSPLPQHDAKISENELVPVAKSTNSVTPSIKEQATLQKQSPNHGNTNTMKDKHELQDTTEEITSLPRKVSQSYINFNSAKKQNLQAQKNISKIKKRGAVLLDLIRLDESSINLFSVSPTAYDEFMISFGNTNTEQAYIQTGDDNVMEESQTDTIEILDLWTQYPPHVGEAVGGDFMSKINKPVEVTGIKDWMHLSNFLNAASRVICSVLEEDQILSSNSTKKDTKSQFDFSDRVAYMQKQNYLQPKGIFSASSITCSKMQPHIFLSICEELPKNKEDDSCHNQMLICVWNINQPAIPQKLLLCRYALPLCCCLDDKAIFAFAGMDDASVALWDLREPDSLHKREVNDGNQWTSLRTPTYSTAGSNAVDGHNGSVIAMQCQQNICSSNNIANKSLGGNQNPQGIIQLATLDEEARIFIWVVTELSKPITDWEHGLSPSGHVKLTKSAVINLQTLSFVQQHLKVHLRAFDFINNPNDSSIFYVATDMGIVSCSLYGGKCKVYGQSLGHGSEATSLSFLPIGKSSFFLAGYNDGTIVLYNSKKEIALMVWKTLVDSAEIVKVKWSTSSPTIFYVLHRDGKMDIWDLKMNDRKSVISISSKIKRITSFDVGNDKRVQDSSATNYQPQIVLCYEDGTVEAHYLTPQYSRIGPDEMNFFIHYVESL